LVLASLLALCFDDVTWFLIILHLSDNSSRQLRQNNFPAETSKGSSLNSVHLCTGVTDLGSVLHDLTLRLFPFGGFCRIILFRHKSEDVGLRKTDNDLLEMFEQLAVSL